MPNTQFGLLQLACYRSAGNFVKLPLYTRSTFLFMPGNKKEGYLLSHLYLPLKAFMLETRRGPAWPGLIESRQWSPAWLITAEHSNFLARSLGSHPKTSIYSIQRFACTSQFGAPVQPSIHFRWSKFSTHKQIHAKMVAALLLLTMSAAFVGASDARGQSDYLTSYDSSAISRAMLTNLQQGESSSSHPVVQPDEMVVQPHKPWHKKDTTLRPALLLLVAIAAVAAMSFLVLQCFGALTSGHSPASAARRLAHGRDPRDCQVSGDDSVSRGTVWVYPPSLAACSGSTTRWACPAPWHHPLRMKQLPLRLTISMAGQRCNYMLTHISKCGL